MMPFSQNRKCALLIHYGSDATLLIMRRLYEIHAAVGLACIGCEVRTDGQGYS